MNKRESKKWRKIKHKLNKDGLITQSEPSCIVAVANAGLGNGVNVDEFICLLKQFGTILDVVSSSAKSYALAMFSNASSAYKCYENLQGYIFNKSAASVIVLYVFFLKSTSWPSTSISKFIDDLPSGLIKLDDFVTPEEEEYLLQNIETDILNDSVQYVCESLKQRTVLHYGYQFRYGSNDVDYSTPINNGILPNYLESVLNKLMRTDKFVLRPDQITINKYNPGDGIPPHTDNITAFEEPLATLSLGSSIVMEMKSPDGLKASILLKPRSLLIFTGDSRYLWTHGITPKKTDVVSNDISGAPEIIIRKTRVSITFRKVVFPSKLLTLPANQVEAIKFEKELVHDVYSNIAQHFSCTREKPWPKVVEFLNDLKPGSFVIDVGCGSGRYLNVNTDICIVGCDYCSSLISICSEKKAPVFICDGLNVPVKSGHFDAFICIAVIHHLSTYQRQLSAINELVRLLCSGGKGLVYVWAAEQKQNNISSSYLKQKKQTDKSLLTLAQETLTSNQKHCPPALVVHKNRTEFVQQDVLVPWKTKQNISKQLEEKFGEKTVSSESTHLRFYHVFKENELENLCNSISDISVINSYYDNGNWAVILQKH